MRAVAARPVWPARLVQVPRRIGETQATFGPFAVTATLVSQVTGTSITGLMPDLSNTNYPIDLVALLIETRFVGGHNGTAIRHPVLVDV